MKLASLINLQPLKEQPSNPTEPIGDFMSKNIDKLDKLRTTSRQSPLEVTSHDDNQLYYIDQEDIEAYIHGETVYGMEKLGAPSKELNRDNSDATPGQIEGEENSEYDDDLRLEPEDDEYEDGTEFEDDDLRLEPELDEDIDEGTCGYGKKGKLGKKPAGPHLIKKSDLRERFIKLAGIIK